MKEISDFYKDDVKENEEVNITPITKGKRILLFLCDLLVFFMVAFVFNNVLTVPTGRSITSFNSKNSEYLESCENMRDIIYQNKLIYQSPELSKSNIQGNIEYTYYCWLSYYVLDSDSSLLSDTNPQFGHKEENEVFNHFYVDIRNKENTYLTFFNSYNTSSLFSVESNIISLKQSFKEELKPYFDPKDELGASGQNLLKTIKDELYVPLYAEMLHDIEINDLSYNGHSYIECNNFNLKFESFVKMFYSITSLIAGLLSWIICYLVVPFINKTHKTVSMMMMRVERINVSRLFVCRLKEAILTSLYSLFTNAFACLFLPMSFLTINYTFNMSLLITVVLISLAYILISLFVLLFSSFNRTLNDQLTQSVIISEEDLDSIYRAKGYEL